MRLTPRYMQLQFDGAFSNPKEWEFIQRLTRAALVGAKKAFPKTPALAQYNEREMDKWRRFAATKSVLRELIMSCHKYKVWESEAGQKSLLPYCRRFLLAIESDQSMACPLDYHSINVGLDFGPDSCLTSLEILRSTVTKRYEGDELEVPTILCSLSTSGWWCSLLAANWWGIPTQLR